MMSKSYLQSEKKDFEDLLNNVHATNKSPQRISKRKRSISPHTDNGSLRSVQSKQRQPRKSFSCPNTNCRNKKGFSSQFNLNRHLQMYDTCFQSLPANDRYECICKEFRTNNVHSFQHHRNKSKNKECRMNELVKLTSGDSTFTRHGVSLPSKEEQAVARSDNLYNRVTTSNHPSFSSPYGGFSSFFHPETVHQFNDDQSKVSLSEHSSLIFTNFDDTSDTTINKNQDNDERDVFCVSVCKEVPATATQYESDDNSNSDDNISLTSHHSVENDYENEEMMQQNFSLSSTSVLQTSTSEVVVSHLRHQSPNQESNLIPYMNHNLLGKKESCTNSCTTNKPKPTHRCCPSNPEPDKDMMEWARIITEHRKTSMRKSSKNVKELQSLYELKEILSKPGIPLKTFDKVLKWHDTHCENKIGGSLPHRSRKSLCNNAQKQLHPPIHMLRGLDNSKTPTRTYGNDPFTQPVLLPSNRVASVTKFEVRYLMVDKLLDMDLLDPKNLLINPLKPGTNLPSNIEIDLEDVNCCGWQRQASVHFECKDGGNVIIISLIFFIDSTVIDKLGKMSIEPVKICFGINTRDFRQLSTSWITVGFVESVQNFGHTRNISSVYTSREKLIDYHHIIDYLLSDIKDLQKKGGFLWKFDEQHGYAPNNPNATSTVTRGQDKEYVIKIPIQQIIGDCKGANQFCCRFGTHGREVKGLCRDCDIPTLQADNHRHQCKFFSTSYIQSLSNEEKTAISFHPIVNAFWDFCFGGDLMGIYGATAPEDLHLLRLGLCMYLYECLWEQLSDAERDIIESKVSEIVKRHHRQSDRDMPVISTFRKKLKAGNTMTGNEKFARIFVLYIALQSRDVYQMLKQRRLKKKKKKKKNNNTNMEQKQSESGKKMYTKTSTTNSQREAGTVEQDDFDVDEWLVLLERTLILDSWMKSKSHKRKDVEEKALDNIRSYMLHFKRVARRGKGNELLLTKFHHLLHIPMYILKFGSGLNFDGGTCEEDLKELKDDARKTQQNNLALSSQTAVRMTERSCCTDLSSKLHDEDLSSPKPLFHSLLDNLQEPKKKPKTALNPDTWYLEGTKFTINQFVPVFDETNNLTKGIESRNPRSSVIFIEWMSKKKPFFNFSSEVTSFLANTLFDEKNQSRSGVIKPSYEINGYTELKRKDKNHLLRSHPCYKATYEWRDWCNIEWYSDVNEQDPTKEIIPARIEMIFEITHGSISGEDDEDDDVERLNPGVYIIAHSAKYRNDAKGSFHTTTYHTNDLKLTKRFTMENVYRIVPVEFIVGPAFVVLDGSCCPNNRMDYKKFKSGKWSEPNVHGDNITGFEVIPRNQWGKNLYNFKETLRPSKSSTKSNRGENRHTDKSNSSNRKKKRKS